MKPHQHEFPVVGTVFNLVHQEGYDIDTLLEQQRAALAAECEAKMFADRMLKLLETCPGFVGADVPQSEDSPGRVTVDPCYGSAARTWLRRRFEVAENIELSPDNALAFDIRPRCRRPGVKRHRFQGRKAEQFTFKL